MAVNTKAKMLFGENAGYIEGAKVKRLHFVTDDKVNEIIRTESEKLEVSISDYIIYVALNFDVSDITEKLSEALTKLNIYIEKNNVKLNYRQRNSKGEFVAMTSTQRNDNADEPVVRKNHFHLRVTQECYDEIKRKAATLSMSVSDYVVFVVTHFDIAEISSKVDEINKKLDAMNSKEQ